LHAAASPAAVPSPPSGARPFPQPSTYVLHLLGLQRAYSHVAPALAQLLIILGTELVTNGRGNSMHQFKIKGGCKRQRLGKDGRSAVKGTPVHRPVDALCIRCLRTKMLDNCLDLTHG
jgi:hypothetical protein